MAEEQIYHIVGQMRKVGKEGRISLPAFYRQLLNIQKGDIFEIHLVNGKDLLFKRIAKDKFQDPLKLTEKE